MVDIYVSDINNKKPVFNPKSQTVHIAENTAVGKIIFESLATDSDNTARLRYSLLQDRISGEDEDKEPVNNIAYLQVLIASMRNVTGENPQTPFPLYLYIVKIENFHP